MLPYLELAKQQGYSVIGKKQTFLENSKKFPKF